MVNVANINSDRISPTDRYKKIGPLKQIANIWKTASPSSQRELKTNAPNIMMSQLMAFTPAPLDLRAMPNPRLTLYMGKTLYYTSQVDSEN